MMQSGNVIDIEDDDDDEEQLNKLEKDKQRLQQLLKKTEEEINRKKMKMTEKEKEESKKHNLSRLVERYEVLNVNNNNNENERIRQEQQLGMNVGNVKKFDEIVLVVEGNICVYNETLKKVTHKYPLEHEDKRREYAIVYFPNGDVALIGGRKNRFDPTTEIVLFTFEKKTFEVIGNLVKQRYNSSAILLSDGRIFIAGGYSSYGEAGQGFNRTCEIFDPRTRESKLCNAQMLVATADSSLVLLKDGKVMILGGFFSDLTKYMNQVISKSSMVQIYDINTDSMSRGGDMVKERSGHTSVLLNDGDVLIFGGVRGKDSLKTEIYSQNTKLFKLGKNLLNILSHTFATVLSDGKVLIFYWESGSHKTEIYDPATKKFSQGVDFM